MTCYQTILVSHVAPGPLILCFNSFDQVADHFPSIDRQSIASLFDADDYTPPTPPHTTISHDENDEGIYLSWTQHMLKSSKISPSAVDDSDSDTDSTNSSLTDDEESSPSMPITPPYLPLERPYSDPESPVDTDTKETKSWLMMPFCGLCLI